MATADAGPSLDGGPLVDARGPCVAFSDLDSDGFGDPSSPIEYPCGTTLPAQTVENSDDCYDGERFANPDATDWYTRDRGDGSWDWDCDGLETLQFPDFETCTMSPAGSQGWEHICLEATGSGCARWNRDTVPGCGEVDGFRGIGCRTSSRTQGCR